MSTETSLQRSCSLKGEGYIEQKKWQRAIIHVDMNAFFASIEQHDRPELRGQPIAVTNGEQGTCIITSSYEARVFGVKTGMRLREAKQLCPHLLRIPSRPHRYAEISRCLMMTLTAITPDIEIFSVDEAFLDVTHCQRLHGTPEKMGQMVRDLIFQFIKLPCSVGVSGDKTTAKFASNLKKPNGFTVILPWEAKSRLRDIPVTELCGINKGIGGFLAKYGVYTCGDMERLPIGVLAKRFGNLGRRLWYMCQGSDPDPVTVEITAPKTMGHGKVMPPRTQDWKTILIYLRHMCEKLAARLRRHDMQAQIFFFGLKDAERNWLGDKIKILEPTYDGSIIYKFGEITLKKFWYGKSVNQIQVTALDPQIAFQQCHLFSEEQLMTHGRDKLNKVMDAINARYGEFTLAPAPLLNRSSMHNVIAPAWRPAGHRQTI